MPRLYLLLLLCGIGASPVLAAPVNTDAETPQSSASLSVPDLVGVYHCGGGYSGRHLTLCPNGKYLMEYWTDALDPKDKGNQRGKSYGIWQVIEGKDGATIVLTPTDDKRPQRSLSSPLTLYVVPWGARRYLLEDKEWESFRDAIAGGQEPRRPHDWGFAGLLRAAHETIPTSGLPAFTPSRQALLERLEPVPWKSPIPSGTLYQPRLANAMMKSFEKGDLLQADQYATELLRRAPYGNRWIKDRYRSIAFQIRGQVALRQGRREDARQFLSKTGDAPDHHSPLLLAAELMTKIRTESNSAEAIADKEAVLRFLDRITSEEEWVKWPWHHSEPAKIAQWRKELMASKAPQ